MKTVIRKMGNSRGVIIPKPLLEMVVEKDAIVLRRPRKNVRAGWAEASKKIAAAGDGALVWPEFANAADAEIKW